MAGSLQGGCRKPNSQVTVFIPTSKPSSLTEGDKPITEAKGASQLKAANGFTTIKLAAARHEFSCLLEENH